MRNLESDIALIERVYGFKKEPFELKDEFRNSNHIQRTYVKVDDKGETFKCVVNVSLNGHYRGTSEYYIDDWKNNTNMAFLSDDANSIVCTNSKRVWHISDGFED